MLIYPNQLGLLGMGNSKVASAARAAQALPERRSVRPAHESSQCAPESCQPPLKALIRLVSR